MIIELGAIILAYRSLVGGINSRVVRVSATLHAEDRSHDAGGENAVIVGASPRTSNRVVGHRMETT